MKCPLCALDLVMSDRQGIEIDYCPKCRGIWLDRGEIDKIIERSQAAEPPRAEPRPAPVAAPAMPSAAPGWTGYAAPPTAAGYAPPPPRPAEQWRRDDDDDQHRQGHHGKKKKGFLSEILDFD